MERLNEAGFEQLVVLPEDRAEEQLPFGIDFERGLQFSGGAFVA